MSLSELCRERLSFVAISFYVLSLLFGSCRLSEFTLAGPLKCTLNVCTTTVYNPLFLSSRKERETFLSVICSNPSWPQNASKNIHEQILLDFMTTFEPSKMHYLSVSHCWLNGVFSFSPRGIVITLILSFLTLFITLFRQ